MTASTIIILANAPYATEAFAPVLTITREIKHCIQKKT